MDDPAKKKASEFAAPSEGEKKVSRRQFVRTSAEVSLIMAALAAGCTSRGSLRRLAVSSRDDFDYIVIGSGAGGGPVAANLAKGGFRVLVLEAGGRDVNPNYAVPAFHGLSTEDASLSWGFFVKHYEKESRQNKNSKHIPGKGVLYPRGSTLGGSTGHNAMITLYPDPQDWDRMGGLTGDRGWNAREMRHYFQRLEKNRYLSAQQAAAMGNGRNGWLQTEQTNPLILLRDRRLLRIVFEAARTEGLSNELIEKLLQQHNIQLDPNRESYVNNKTEGLFNIPRATALGRRNGTRELLLRTAEAYPQNLEIRTDCLVTRVLFDDVDRNRVVGVEYLDGKALYRADARASSATAASARKYQVRAGREVILAGGAFNSPQLLMLSGVGDPAELRRHGIDVRVPLPGVGRNLQDRYEVGVVTRMKDSFELLQGCRWGGAGDPCMEEYRQNRMGSVYATNGVVISLFKRSSPSRINPDLAIFGIPGAFRGYYPGWSRDAIRPDHFTWAILKGQTNNRGGVVKLKSGDPLDPPDVCFHYFDEGTDSAGEDLEAVIKGIKIARRIQGRLGVRTMVDDETTPGSTLKTDLDLRAFVQREAWGHHASCSNKMGAANDPAAVVDSRFRVHGAKGLRVVDASVFPRIPGLFIVVPIYMLAERASDLILQDSAGHEASVITGEAASSSS